MARTDNFDFDLFRLTIHDGELLLPFMGEAIRTEDQILSVLGAACSSKLDFFQETKTATYVWGLRSLVELPRSAAHGARAVAVQLAKGTIEKDGVVFAPDTLEIGTSVAQPPTAQVATLVFQLTRHLVAVEFRSSVTRGTGWLRAFHEIVRRAASQLDFTSTLELQAKPKRSEILQTFHSFQRLTRIRVQLLLPNPDLTRFTKALFEELESGGIREYIADMRNPRGLNQQEGELPHAAAAMAEDGYKKGEVLMEGLRKGKKETVKTGTRPARGTVDGIKDFVRGLAAAARTKEARQMTDALLAEIDRVSDTSEVT